MTTATKRITMSLDSREREMLANVRKALSNARNRGRKGEPLKSLQGYVPGMGGEALENAMAKQMERDIAECFGDRERPVSEVTKCVMLNLYFMLIDAYNKGIEDGSALPAATGTGASVTNQ